MSSPSHNVAVDLQVFKALTARLEQEGQTHNDVLREILALDSPVEVEDRAEVFSAVADTVMRSMNPGAFYSRGLLLPDGTKLRARYKGKEYQSTIEEGRWRTPDGLVFDSPSAAASSITSTVVNGLRFWEGKRPGDDGWRRLDVIRDSQR